MDAAKKQRYIFIAVINILSIAVFAVLTAVLFFLRESLPSQLAASRWNSGEERFSQVSVFYSDDSRTDLNGVYTMRVNIEKKLAENSVEAASPNARLWIDAFSTSLPLSVSSSRSDHTVTADVNCIATGGDYFLFHPLKLLSGCYYSENDLMQDRVILDHNLAWQLFGSNDIEGMTVVINGQRFYIAGVILPDSDSASDYADGETPVMYMSYTALDKLMSGVPTAINSYEACLPDPVTGLAEKIIRDVSGADDKNIRVISNTERYSLKNLWNIAFDGGKRAVSEYPFVYPFWENAARIVEERAASVFTAVLVSLIIPLLTLCGLLRLLIKRRRLILKSAADRIVTAFANHRNASKSKRQNTF
ncbi:MAG: ABC transporter permease [Oscillospiraceae bacterium]|nr:ABC transporter permease [Oscillospiraceae bacterium]